MPLLNRRPLVYGKSEPVRLVYVVTHPMSARLLLRGQLAYMRERGFEVTLITSPGEGLQAVQEREGVTVVPLPIPREIRPVQDLKALWKLWRAFVRLRPAVVNAGTTKAGLLGMMAARLARVPVRVYVLRGLRLETAQGLSRKVLSAAEQAASFCATRVVAVSESLRRKYVALRYAPAEKVTVMCSGSSNGVDAERFAPVEPGTLDQRRAELNLPKGAPVIGFVGRFTRDKGITELIEAFEALTGRFAEARLLLVGDHEKGDRVPPAYARRMETHPHIISTGFVKDVAPYYQLMDVLAFPSHREGFPNVPLEAAASGVPTVGARATGTVDAVVEGTTGTLVDVGSAEQLRCALCEYLDDDARRRLHGQAGRTRVLESFRSESVWHALYDEYVRLLRARGLPEPAAASKAAGRSAAGSPSSGLPT